MTDLKTSISFDEAEEYAALKAEKWSPRSSVLRQIAASYDKARLKHRPMQSPHEGYAILLEELDELWDEVKAWQPMPVGYTDRAADHPGAPPHGDFLYGENMQRMRKEALHVAAMALAFLLEVASE